MGSNEEDKNQTTSQDQKNLSGKQNHATSHVSKLVYKAPNFSKWHQLCSNLSNQVRIGPNGSKLVQTFPKGTKWVQMEQLGPNRSKWVQMSLQGSKIGVQNYHELNWMALKPRSPGSCCIQLCFQSMGPCFLQVICPSVCLSVCLFVRLFTFEVPFKRLCALTSRSWMSKTFRDLKSLGKVMERSGITCENFY